MRTLLLALFFAFAYSSFSQNYHCAAIDFEPTNNYYTLSPLSLLPENAGGTAVYTLTYGNGEVTTVESTELILNPSQLALIAEFGADLCFTWGEQNEICSIPVCYLLDYANDELIVSLADYPCEIHVEYSWIDENTISIENESIIGSNADSAVYLVVINGQIFPEFPVVYTYALNEETAFSVLMETFAEGNTVCQNNETIEPVQPNNECATTLTYTETGCNSFLFSLDGLPLDANVHWWVGPEDDEDFFNSSSTLAYTFENPGIYRVVAQVMGGYDLNCESYFFEIENLIADCVPEGCPQISMTQVNCSTYLFEAVGAEDGSVSVYSGQNVFSENDPSLEYTFCFPYFSWYQFLDATYTGPGCEQGVTFEFEQVVELCMDYPTISYNNPGDCSDLNYTLTLENIPQEIITTWWTIYQMVDGNLEVLDYFEGESTIEYTFPESGAYIAYAYADVLNCGTIETDNIPINVCSEICPTQLSAVAVNCNYYEFNILDAIIPNTVSWNFGDGAEDISDQSNEYSYSGNGTYVVTANYISEFCPEGVVLETTVTISCAEECPQTILTAPTGVCTEVGFYLGSGNNPEAEVIWYFDDEPGIPFGDFLYWGWGNDNDIIHDVCAYYESPQCPGGTEVCIEYSQNCSDSCNWQFNLQEITCGYYHLFTNETPNENTTYFIDWGDGTSGYIGAFDTHVYTSNGTFELCVTRESAACGTITNCQSIVVENCWENCSLELNTTFSQGFNFTFEVSGTLSDSPLNWNINNESYFQADSPLEIVLDGYQEYSICVFVETELCGLVEDCINVVVSDSLCPDFIGIAEESSCNEFLFELSPISNYSTLWTVDGSEIESDLTGNFNYTFGEYGLHTICVEGTSDNCPGGFLLCTQVEIDSCSTCEEGSFPIYFNAYACCNVPELDGYNSDIEADIFDSEGNYVTWWPLVDNVVGLPATSSSFLCLNPGCYSLVIYYEGLELIDSTNYFTSFLFSSPYFTNFEIVEQYGNLPTLINFCIQSETECAISLTSLELNANNYQFQANTNSDDSPIQWSVNGELQETDSATLLYAFDEPGTYTICCSTETELCGVQVDCVNITIGEVSCPDEISITETGECHQYIFGIDGWSENSGYDITWNIGGQTIDNANEFLHEFALAGDSYPVCVYGSTETCPDGFEICTKLLVEPCGANEEGCPAYIFSTPVDSCGAWVFEAGWPSTNSGSSIVWDFGDGTQSDIFELTTFHQYAVDGEYTVSVTILNYGEGCDESIFIETSIVVNTCEADPCDISLNVYEGSTCGSFIFIAGDYVPGESFVWFFGDGIQVIGGHYIEYQFSESGTYTVSCEFSNNDCVGGQLSTTVLVEDCPETCSDVFLGLTSDPNNGGPETIYWVLLNSTNDVVEFGTLQFTEDSTNADFGFCLVDDCYTLVLEGLGVGQLDLIDWYVQMAGNDIIQNIEYFNENLVQLTFGVNSNCVDSVDENLHQMFSIYPNPGNDFVTISDGSGKPIDFITVLDSSGRMVMQASQTGQINVSSLASGCYFVRIMTQSHSTTLPLFVRH